MKYYNVHVLVHTHLCVYICSTTTLAPCSHRSEYQRFSLSVVDSLTSTFRTMTILYHFPRACVREINANIDISNTHSQIPTRARLNWRKKSTRRNKKEWNRVEPSCGERGNERKNVIVHMRILHIRRSTYNRLRNVTACMCVGVCLSVCPLARSFVRVLIVRSARLFVLVAWLSYRVRVCARLIDVSHAYTERPFKISCFQHRIYKYMDRQKASLPRVQHSVGFVSRAILVHSAIPHRKPHILKRAHI